MKIFSITLFLLIIVSFTSCVEWFDPEIDSFDDVLVVEGLLTDKEEKHLVKLSKSSPYSNQQEYNAVESAQVYVTDQFGNDYLFYEEEAGFYYSDNDFHAQKGVSYTLTVEYDDNVYVSNEQVLSNPLTVDSLIVNWETREELVTDFYGDIVLEEVEGAAVYADIKNPEGGFPMLRFEPVLLVQYVLAEADTEDPDYFFCRRKYKLDDKINLTTTAYESDNSSSNFHNVGFVKDVFRVVPHVDTLVFKMRSRRILILRQYALNQESFSFYRELKKHLESEGELFDPMPSQLKGNISCITDPDKQALGFFEVSSYSSATYVFSPEPLNSDNHDLWEINDLDFLPDFEVSLGTYPEHWVLL